MGAAVWKTAAPQGLARRPHYLAGKAEAGYEVQCQANELVIA